MAKLLRMVINQILYRGKKEHIKLQPGVYFLRFEAGKDEAIQKVIIL